MEQFTEQESRALFEVLSRLQLSPVAPDAAESVALWQSILSKIKANTETAQKSEKE